MIIKSVGGLKDSGVRLDCITNPEFFANNPSTTRVFPTNGFKWGTWSKDIDDLGAEGGYWSSTPVGPHLPKQVNSVSFDHDAIWVSTGGAGLEKSFGNPVRPFILK